MTIRRATEADVSTVVDLWNEAQQWLRDNGYDQWQYPVKVHNIRKAVAAQACWIVEDEQGEPIATVTLDEDADPALWTTADQPEQALYLHRLVVRADRRALDLGSAILDWASLRARQLGKAWLRLDAWTTNARLQDYYRSRGFRLVRTVRGTGIVSGVLFERAAGGARGAGPAIETLDGAVGT